MPFVGLKLVILDGGKIKENQTEDPHVFFCRNRVIFVICMVSKRKILLIRLLEVLVRILVHLHNTNWYVIKANNLTVHQ